MEKSCPFASPMKAATLILLATLLLGLLPLHADDAPRRLLISGLTWHDKKELDDGTKLNPYNIGIGYERDYFKEYKKFYYTYHVMLINDSHRDPFIYLAGSKSVRFHLARMDASIGLAGYLGFKNMRHNDGSYHYSPIVGLAPVASGYIPGINYGSFKTIGFLYMYLGWRL